MDRQVPGGWKAVDALFAAPPVSTEQVLHPEKLAAREAPVPVTLPADLASKIGPGWTADPDDTIGEFQLREWLTALGVAQAQAGTAAAGWGGDRVGYVMGPDGRWLLMLVTAWDTPADAAEFQAAADTALATAGHPGVTKTQGGDVVVLIANDASTLDNISPLAMKAGPFR
jgi:hypothetical protein